LAVRARITSMIAGRMDRKMIARITSVRLSLIKGMFPNRNPA
jgi:hypothetical protein